MSAEKVDGLSVALLAGDPSTSGATHRIIELADRLASLGHRPVIVCTRLNRDLASTGLGVKIVRARPTLPDGPLRLRGFASGLAWVPAIAAITGTGGFDVAHAFDTADGAAAVLARGLGGPPAVFTCLSAPARNELAARRLSFSLAKKAFFGSDAVLASAPGVAAAISRWLALAVDVADLGEAERYEAIYEDCIRRSR